MAESGKAVFNVPLKTLVQDHEKQLIEVRHDTTVAEVLRIMKEHDILSVPVRGPAADRTTPGNPDECLGIVNLVDIVNYCIFSIAEGDEYLRVNLSNLDRLDQWASSVVGVFSTEGASEWSFKTYANSDLLSEVMYPMAAGVHRVLVFNPETHREALLSQTDVVRFIHENRDRVDQTVLNGTIAPRGSVLTMHSDQRALVGFRRMCQHDRSSIAIVDADGKLVGNLSLSDLRGLDRATFGDLGDPVLAFLAARAEGVVKPVVSVAPDASLGSMIAKMLSNKVHRVWVVDAENRPVGQVSMSDVIMRFADLTIPLKMPEA
eukprot:a676594_640.p2 GENE.a676594_640~~a676594_640.p2  ORF type:complete len:332 (-),score=150.69 a676594_640:58-1014(-)